MVSILVVDDHLDTCRVLVRLLHAQGFLATCETSGADALQSVKRAIPDLVLLDYMMPVMDGLTVLKELRSQERLMGVRIVIYTAFTDDAFETSAIACGADAVWHKGMGFADLGLKIRAQLRPLRTKV